MLPFTSELVFQLYALTCGVKVLENVVLSVLFYECETAVKVQEEHGLILLKNIFLRRILGPDREEVTESTGAKFIILSKYTHKNTHTHTQTHTHTPTLIHKIFSRRYMAGNIYQATLLEDVV